MKTFIVHVSVDAETREIAEMLVKSCISSESHSWINTEKGECAVVLDGNTDEVEGSEFTPEEAKDVS